MKDNGVAIPQQDEIRIFVNQGGNISIAQKDSCGEEAIVYLAAAHATALISAIRHAAKEAQEAE